MKIKQQISKINGLDRVVSIGQIAYMDFDIEEAKIRFDVTIPSLGITQSVWTVISNSNKVTEQGLMITRDYVKSLAHKKPKSAALPLAFIASNKLIPDTPKTP